MMENGVKEFLYAPQNIYSRILAQREKIIALRLGMLPSAIRYDKDPVQTSPEDPMPEFAAKLDEAERELDVLLEEYRQAIWDVYDVICTIPDMRVRVVMVKRYVRGKSWTKIEEECHKSRRTLFRQNRMGVRLVGIFLADKKKSCLPLNGTP